MVTRLHLLPIALFLLGTLVVSLLLSAGYVIPSLGFALVFAWILQLVYFIFFREEEVQN